MSSPVYSTRFLAGVGVTTAIVFTCPTGFVTVLRDLDTFYAGLLVATARLIGSEGQTIWANAFAGGSEPEYASWRGRQVLIAGETVSLDSSGATDMTLSGYLLTTP